MQRIHRCFIKLKELGGLFVSFTDLKGLLGDFFRAFLMMRTLKHAFARLSFLLPSPSAECDIRVGGGKWMEVAGCGMIHPNVLDSGKMESNCRGFAFGMGVERLAMLYYGVTDIRSVFENDLRFLGHFRANENLLPLACEFYHGGG